MFKWNEYQNLQKYSTPPHQLRHAHIVQMLSELQAIRPEAMELSTRGESYEGRSILCATIGSGSNRVLAWSQMHGNEPTHTAALLDLIGFLQRDPDHETAQAILEGSTLSLVLMLNPDGAERYQRRNAQDLDINRDALHLASPEGRILHDLVESLHPQFALNLHNQNPRTAVDYNGLKPAAVSLLVPPIDAADSQTEGTQQAKRLASVFLSAVQPHCEGMISRYDADYMPRCFGEWVQQQGSATLTVEAGGWTSIDSSPLVRLHFMGLIHVLEAIATNRFLDADPADYDQLPRSSEHYLFDLMINKVRVVNGDLANSFVADLGINVSGVGPCSSGAGGTIEDMGDLHVTTGKTNIAGDGLLCLPGRIAYLPHITPSRLPTPKEVEKCLRVGVTTLIGRVDYASDDELIALEQLSDSQELTINLGFIAAQSTRSVPGRQMDSLSSAILQGVLGMLSDAIPDPTRNTLGSLNFRLFYEHQLPGDLDTLIPIDVYSKQLEYVADFLGLTGRGQIQLGTPADLLLLRTPATHGNQTTIDWNDLQQVIVAGRVVFDGEKCLNERAGKLLKGSAFRN